MSVGRMAWRAILRGIANLCPSDAARASIYRAYGVRVGRDVFIGADVLFDRLHPECIRVGDRTAIGTRTIVMAHQLVPTSTVLGRLYPYGRFETVIENDVWIMPGVIVAPGVRIGHHSVIATGAVVHDEVPPYSLVVGGGYRVARSLEEAVRRAEGEPPTASAHGA
ncbi:MAG: acyltransferase [Alphaproteobacteria bacterium]